MKIHLTNYLLDFLAKRGYRFLLSRTERAMNGDHSILISLKPVKNKPQLTRLPAGFDTFFNIGEEPVQMAEGREDTKTLVDLHTEDITNFKQYLIRMLSSDSPDPLQVVN